MTQWEQKLRFTWYAQDFSDNDRLVLKLDFDSPVQVSLRDFKDSIEVEFLNTEQFVELGEEEPYLPDGYKLGKIMPSQLAKYSRYDFLEFLNILFTVTWVICVLYLVIMTALNVSKHYFWSFLYSMQIYCHFLLFDLQWAANSHVLLRAFIEPARLRIFPGIDWAESLLVLRGKNGLSWTFNWASYDHWDMAQTLSFLNLTSLAVLAIICLSWFAQRFLKIKFKKKMRHLNEFISKAKWQALHRLCLLAIIEIILCTCIFLLSGKTSFWSVFLTIVYGLALVYLTYRLLVVVTNGYQFGYQSFDERNDTFYDILRWNAVKWQTEASKYYYVLFAVRRVLFVTILVALPNHPG